ncbi:MAG: exo-alpha-sialidase [Fimbriimonadaceae bacterium]|nr:exo-alpha-sialidase [Fimbriimonadaceae bacterium]
MIASIATFALLAAPSQSSSWDVRRLGNGGETFVATDGAGAVYATSHLPTQVFSSQDWGASFASPKVFGDALGDMIVLVRGKGEATVCYMPKSLDGMVTHATKDFGKTWERGDGIRGRPLDREWLAYDPATKRTYLNYSDGYIGGPRSKGVFVAASTDGGLSFGTDVRADNLTEGNYAIDPGLSISSTGTLYNMYTSSSDYNTVDSYHFSYSTDQGKTFTGHRKIEGVNKDLGDTQERWMLGGVTAHGESLVTVFYVNYVSVTIEGKEYRPLLAMYRTSTDGGKTFEPSKIASPQGELEKAVLAHAKSRGADSEAPFVQCVPWACYDAAGRLHMVWQDNRAGSAEAGRSKWTVRHAVAGEKGTLGASEQVSAPYEAIRPPMDFMACAADSKYIYVTWTENPGSTNAWDFTGTFYFAKKSLGGP